MCLSQLNWRFSISKLKVHENISKWLISKQHQHTRRMIEQMTSFIYCHELCQIQNLELGNMFFFDQAVLQACTQASAQV